MQLFLWVIFVFFPRSAGTCHMLLGCSLGGLSALFFGGLSASFFPGLLGRATCRILGLLAGILQC